MSKIMQDIYDQGREEAREEEREERNIAFVINMLKYNQPVELISKVLEMPVEKIVSIGKEKGLIV